MPIAIPGKVWIVVAETKRVEGRQPDPPGERRIDSAAHTDAEFTDDHAGEDTNQEIRKDGDPSPGGGVVAAGQARENADQVVGERRIVCEDVFGGGGVNRRAGDRLLAEVGSATFVVADRIVSPDAGKRTPGKEQAQHRQNEERHGPRSAVSAPWPAIGRSQFGAGGTFCGSSGGAGPGFDFCHRGSPYHHIIRRSRARISSAASGADDLFQLANAVGKGRVRCEVFGQPGGVRRDAGEALHGTEDGERVEAREAGGPGGIAIGVQLHSCLA